MVRIIKTVIKRFKQTEPAKLLVLAAVLLLGTGSLTAIFADSSDYKTPNLGVSASAGTDNVGLAFSNAGKNSGSQPTGNGWQLTWVTGNTLVGTKSISDPNLNGVLTSLSLKCGLTYNFAVEVTYNGAQESPAAKGSATIDCGSLSVDFVANSSTVGTDSWSTTSNVNDISTFDVYLSQIDGGGSVVGHVNVGSGSRSAGFSIGCGHTYIGSVIENLREGGTIGAQSDQVTSPDCPVATPPSSPDGGGGSSGGGGTTGSGSGSSSGSSGSSSSTSHSSSSSHASSSTATSNTGNTSSGATVQAPQPPGAPTNFMAQVQSSKVVELSWGPSAASAGIASYNLQSSTDNTNWSDLTTADGDTTSYEDDNAAFSTTYYYRVQAADNNGNVSDYATTQVTTGAFQASDSSSVTSDDKLAKVSIPDGAFDQATDCSISSADASSASSPKGKLLLAGPYSLLCVGADGTIITSFHKPLSFVVSLNRIGVGFSNFSVATIDGNKLSAVKSTYNSKNQEISFTLSSAHSFAVYGTHHKSIVGTIVGIFFTLLILVGIVFGILFLKRRMAGGGPSPLVTAEMAQQSVAGQAPPKCSHLNMAHQVQPRTDGCEECLSSGTQWKALRICLTCGHVGCSDDSDNRHAHAHYEETGHPLVMVYGDPAAANLGWCYADQLYI